MVATPQVLYVGLLSATVLAVVGVAVWVVRHNTGTDAKVFVALAGSIALWGVLRIARDVAPDPGTGAVLTPVLFALGTAVGPLWLAFVLYYTGRQDRAPDGWRVVAGVVYAVTALLVVTNPVHQFVFRGFRVAAGPPAHVAYAKGPGYWLAFLVLVVFVTAGVVELGRFLLSVRKVVEGRTIAAVLLAPVVPVVLQFGAPEDLEFGIINAIPETIEYGVFGLGVFVVVEALTLYRIDLSGAVPVARSAVIDEVDDLTIVSSPEGQLIDFNQPAERVFPALGGSEGRQVIDVVPDLIADPEADDGDRFVEELTTFVDDEQRVYNVTVSELERDDEVRGYVLLLEDVSDIKTYAEQLEQEAQQLDQFASTVSHDLRNPLSIADSRLEELDDPELRSELDESFDRIESLIDDALTLARTGRAIEDRSLEPLGEVVRTAWNRTKLDDATLEVAVEDAVTVYTERERLVQLFENLFQVAADHADGELTARVAVEQDSGDGPDRIVVRMEGSGVDRMQRDESEDSETLALAVVDTIAEAHGWETETARGDDVTEYSLVGVEVAVMRQRSVETAA